MSMIQIVEAFLVREQCALDRVESDPNAHADDIHALAGSVSAIQELLSQLQAAEQAQQAAFMQVLDEHLADAQRGLDDSIRLRSPGDDPNYCEYDQGILAGLRQLHEALTQSPVS